MKRIFTLLLATVLVLSLSFTSVATGKENTEATPEMLLGGAPKISAKSAILMEAKTGTVLYRKNDEEALPPASVTKIMTLLLIAEGIEEGKIHLEDKVIISENAASMGGSQVFLKEGEEMTVDELLKCTVIASANDASVALAEHLSGSEEAFVRRMNDKAEELSLKGCHFENTTGLDDTVTNHTMSASDIATLSAKLIQYSFITKYSGLWQDTIRDGEFTLTNTNRLVRYYDGCNGLKTGSTDKAGYCISVSASRAGVNLICVIMGAESKEIRNEEARALLDFAFSSVALYESPALVLEKIPVHKSSKESIWIKEEGFLYLCEKGKNKSIEKIYDIPESVHAPLAMGDCIGSVKYYLDGKCIGECKIVAEEAANTLSFKEMIKLIFFRMIPLKKI